VYATKATFDAIWDWDIINDHLYWGEGYEKIFGYKISSKIDNHIHSFDNIHPDDRKAVFDGIDELIKGSASNWTGEYRYKRITGEYVYVQDRAVIIRMRPAKQCV
jgi:PAS domain-containing protein